MPSLKLGRQFHNLPMDLLFGGRSFIMFTVRQKIMSLVDFLETSFQNVRSSKRTDDLHEVLLREVLIQNPQWSCTGGLKGLDWKFEYK